MVEFPTKAMLTLVLFSVLLNARLPMVMAASAFEISAPESAPPRPRAIR
jgi:hypothetical protein